MMRITTPTGEVQTVAFSGNCTGYVAERIEITPADLNAMMSMSPEHLLVCLQQLKNRFPSQRMQGWIDEDPEPTAGEVWDVVLPDASPGHVSRLYVAELTDRMVALKPVARDALRDRWEPHAGPGGLTRLKRDAVEFVERVQ